MTCSTLNLDSDNELTLTGVYNATTSTYINDAVVELTLVNKTTGIELTGQSWPLTMAYVTASDGNYAGTLQDTIIAVDGQEVTANITIDGDGLQLTLALDFTYVTGTAATLAWTSRDELERMFGRSNIAQWADLENEQSATDISQQVQWAVDAATEDAKQRLDGTWAVPDTMTSVPTPLRLMVTRLAGVLLYESRGIKDVDESGRGWHRLSRHQKLADDYFQAVQAGQIKIGAGTINYPKFIAFDSDNTDAEDIAAGEEILY